MENQFEFALATDLDGTFMEGDFNSKSFFYSELLSKQKKVLLIYVTGRTVESVKELCSKGYLPTPHFVIGDHGTHIVDGSNFQPIMELQIPIIKSWNESHDSLKRLLQNEVGIELQPVVSPYRLAYYYNPSLMKQQTVEKIVEAGFDVILSCDMYLDIVPFGVSKGSSLLKLLEKLNFNKELTITAGDSLNDLSLFETGLKGIAVSNAEPKLVNEVKKLDNVYLSDFPGVLGIMDGLKFYQRETSCIKREPPTKTM